MSALSQMMEQDAAALCGPHYCHRDGRPGHRWGKTQGKIGFHGGKVSLDRPRVRGRGGREMLVPRWEVAQSEDLLARWAMNLMPINVSTRRFACAVRLPEGDIPTGKGDGVSKSAVSRTHRSSAARSTRAATSWSDCRNTCTPRSGERSARPGNWMMWGRRNNCSAILRVDWSRRRPACPRPSSRGSAKS